MYKCDICKKKFNDADMYEYRGALFCSDCFDEGCKQRDIERAEIIEEQKHKTDSFKGLDFGNNVIGNANRIILKQNIEIAKKESVKIRNYEKTI